MAMPLQPTKLENILMLKSRHLTPFQRRKISSLLTDGFIVLSSLSCCHCVVIVCIVHCVVVVRVVHCVVVVLSLRCHYIVIVVALLLHCCCIVVVLLLRCCCVVIVRCVVIVHCIVIVRIVHCFLVHVVILCHRHWFHLSHVVSFSHWCHRLVSFPHTLRLMRLNHLNVIALVVYVAPQSSEWCVIALGIDSNNRKKRKKKMHSKKKCDFYWSSSGPVRCSPNSEPEPRVRFSIQEKGSLNWTEPDLSSTNQDADI